MHKVPRRPFYAEYAWAFDLLIDRPVRKECAVMAAWLKERGILPGTEVLDAGCGTGRNAIELARRGDVVHGMDLSPELIDVAAFRHERLTSACSRRRPGDHGPPRLSGMTEGAQAVGFDMKNNSIQLLILFTAGIAGTWLVGPPLRLWEVLLIGSASAIGVGALLGTLLIKGGFLSPGGIWGDGSVFRVVQGIGLAVFVYGSVRDSTTLIGIGALGFAVGSIMEMRRGRLQRGA